MLGAIERLGLSTLPFAVGCALLASSPRVLAGDPVSDGSRLAVETADEDADENAQALDDDFAYSCTDASDESAPMSESVAPRSVAGGCGGMPDCGSYCCDFGEVCVGMNSCCADHVPYPCFSNNTCYADPNACPDDTPTDPDTGVGGCTLDKAYTFNSCATTVCGCADDCTSDSQCTSGCCADGWCAAACVCSGAGTTAFCNGDGQVVDVNLNEGGTDAGAASCSVDRGAHGGRTWPFAMLALLLGAAARRRRA